MKTLSNASARDLKQAVSLAEQARRDGKSVAFAGGGADLLGLVKERIVTPDVIVHLKAVKGLDTITLNSKGLTIGAEATLDAIASHPQIRQHYTALAEAANVVATPQIRNVGTIGGNVNQRPWCWYFRQGFKCFKAGGDTCYSIAGENQFHAIFGGGPSFIVHPSDTAPALVALNAEFHITGPSGERKVAAGDYFTLPKADAAKENVLAPGEILSSIHIPAPKAGTKSTYNKVMDREAWTHAVIAVAAVVEVEKGVCRSARIVLGGVAPIPWHIPDAEKLLTGQKITPELAAQVGTAAIKGANPLAKNGYKLPLTEATVKRTIAGLA